MHIFLILCVKKQKLHFYKVLPQCKVVSRKSTGVIVWNTVSLDRMTKWWISVCVSCSVMSNSVTPWISPPGSSVHRILLAIILEWVAIPFFRGSSWLRDQTCISYVSCIGRWVLDPLNYRSLWLFKLGYLGMSLVVQWLRLCVPNVGDPVSMVGELVPPCQN